MYRSKIAKGKEERRREKKRIEKKKKTDIVFYLQTPPLSGL